MGRPRVSNGSEGHHPLQKRGSGGGVGGNAGKTRGEPHQADAGSGNGNRQSSPSTTVGNTDARWLSSRERLSNSTSAPAGVGLASQERETSTVPKNNQRNKLYHNSNNLLVKDYGRAGNESTPSLLSRNDSLGSSQSQARAQTVNSLRRTSSSISDAYGSGGGFSGSSSSSASSAARVAVTSSSDPEVLKAEIHRLQAALMNEFKGGNRFVGGAQFKASKSTRSGQRNGGVSGRPCGGCLQVRV